MWTVTCSNAVINGHNLLFILNHDTEYIKSRILSSIYSTQGFYSTFPFNGVSFYFLMLTILSINCMDLCSYYPYLSEQSGIDLYLQCFTHRQVRPLMLSCSLEKSNRIQTFMNNMYFYLGIMYISR